MVILVRTPGRVTLSILVFLQYKTNYECLQNVILTTVLWKKPTQVGANSK